ncbi:hypothetical protein [Mesorhizobium sp. M1E.F.Ca.ET.041.01.1.1]|uniref:hypothetical protein n=1 Tax=Mesorhizobium sp. M1E.F.Ca.ET.041.01.1.1 TaxID=2496759 RepID=UPI000FCA9A46|nr:hypothetical protein [Mesorhizobium sp. M1E.F.Ca.ET.041.01.1.1]RUW33781.1 hypothetical protein EOA38_12070 [Mesorhizobium sp. M1E.F.Ca.ET.041.01.1.1]RWD92379.1 MAG: hypothetical protein EOS38_00670 [Mesorhizobium sp.]
MRFASMIVAVFIVQGDKQPVVDHVTEVEIVHATDCADVIANKYGPAYPHAEEINGRKVLSLSFHCVPLPEVQARKALETMGAE